MQAESSSIVWVSAMVGLTVAFGIHPLLSLLDSFNRRLTSDLRTRMLELGLPTDSLDSVLRTWWIAAGVLFVVLWFVAGMPPMAIMAAFVMYTLIRPGIEMWANRRRVQLRDQLVGAARGLANQVKAGVSLPQGISAVANETMNPLGGELRRTASEYHQGTPLSQVLADLKNRLKFESMTLFVVAIAVCHERGGDLGYALERTCHSLEEQQRVERKRDADTAAGQMLVGVLACFPIGFLAMFSFLDPEGTGVVFRRFEGQLVLCLVVGMVYASIRWANSILAMKE